MVKSEQMIAYDEEDTDKYTNLKSKRSSPFYQSSYADIFLFALGVAIQNDLPPRKLKKRVPNIPIGAFNGKLWLVYSIAISEKNTHKVLFDASEAHEIAEMYANAGIKHLYKEIFDKPGDIYKKIESWVQDSK